MSGYWNHTTQTGLFQGRNGGQSQPYQNDDPGFNVLARDAGEVILGQGPYIDNVRPGQEALGLYPAVDTAPTPPDRYYSLDQTTPYAFALAGQEFQFGTTVERTHNWVSLSIDDILLRRLDEVDAQLFSVMTANAQSSERANWVISLTEGNRLWIADVVNRLADRLETGGNYWQRDVPVAGINKTTGNRESFSVNRTQWTTVILDIATHGFAAVDTAATARNDLEALHAAGTRDALVNYDIINTPTPGWPPVWTP